MASPGAPDGVSETSDSTFPAVDVDKELNPGENMDFHVDPIASEVATSLEIKVALGTLPHFQIWLQKIRPNEKKKKKKRSRFCGNNNNGLPK